MAKKSTNEVKAGGASVTIGGDDSLFKRVIASTEKRLTAFAKNARDIGSRLSLTGGGFLAGAAAIATSFMEVASTAGSAASKIGLTGEDVKAAMQMKGAYLELWRAITEVKNALGAALAPAFTALFRAVSPLLKSFATWIRQNQGLARVFVIGAAFATVFGAALIGLGVAASMLVTALGALTAIVAALSATGVLPVLALLAGVGGLGALIGKLTGQLGSWATAIKKAFGDVVSYVNWIATGIADALMGGDAMLAIDIFWKGFQLAGLRAVRSIADAMKKALGPLYVNMGGQNFLGITDAQLKQRQDELNALIAQAKGLVQGQQQKGAGIPETLANAPTAANARFSSGAASTIARAYNTQQLLPLKTLAAIQAGNKLLGQLLKKPQVNIKNVGGP